MFTEFRGLGEAGGKDEHEASNSLGVESSLGIGSMGCSHRVGGDKFGDCFSHLFMNGEAAAPKGRLGRGQSRLCTAVWRCCSPPPSWLQVA